MISDLKKKRKNEYLKKYRKSIKYREYQKKYTSSASFKKYKRKYQSSEKRRIYKRKYLKNKRMCDPLFKLRRNLRVSIRTGIRDNVKSGSFVRDLGCTISKLKLHLESQFQEGMTWDNWSLKGWHIDHIKPLSSFDLQDREQFLKAVHYTNLQPLWAKDNIKKSNK